MNFYICYDFRLSDSVFYSLMFCKVTEFQELSLYGEIIQNIGILIVQKVTVQLATKITLLGCSRNASGDHFTSATLETWSRDVSELFS